MSITGSVAKFAVRNAMGTNTPNSGKKQQFNWNNYNFPPIIRIIHFDLTELPDGERLGVRCAFWSVNIMVITAVINFIMCIAAAAVAKGDYWKWLILSLINIIIFVMLHLFVTNFSYRAVALRNSTPILYYIGQALVCVLGFVYFLLPYIFFHGLISIGGKRPGNKTFWVVCPIIEAICWLGSIVLGVIAFILVTRDARKDSEPGAFESYA
ncbi:MAG: hypothetical protein EZS28_013306 [Streblomastix strix]|uniref:MARVEL domain-containing protein n=1 Tax=Streblomastix strix TaxID=222440 RepID=A0A5J4W8E1_9EUKA|nr:MAG: hypothetical protein EZS28_013306 [Streblomastix strix]